MPRAETNHDYVLRILKTAGAPMTAYEVLGAAKKRAISAPPTIYRALNRLIRDGLVHRLESINAYVACSAAHRHDSAAFAICNDCGRVEEIEEAKTIGRLAKKAAGKGFTIDQTIVELRGRCADCAIA